MEIIHRLPPQRAAEYLCLSVKTLATMRMKGTGPAFTRLGSGTRGGRIFYSIDDLDKWIESRRAVSTSQYLNNLGEHTNV